MGSLWPAAGCSLPTGSGGPHLQEAPARGGRVPRTELRIYGSHQSLLVPGDDADM